jgi:hypothetical protein
LLVIGHRRAFLFAPSTSHHRIWILVITPPRQQVLNLFISEPYDCSHKNTETLTPNETATNMNQMLKFVRDIPSVMAFHFREGNINWPMGIYITLVHVVAVYALFFKLSLCSAETLLWAFVLWPIRYATIHDQLVSLLLRPDTYTLAILRFTVDLA